MKPGSKSSPERLSGFFQDFRLVHPGPVDISPTLSRVDPPTERCATVHPFLHLGQKWRETVAARTDFNNEIGGAVDGSPVLGRSEVVIPFLGNPGCVGNALRPTGQLESDGWTVAHSSVGTLPNVQFTASVRPLLGCCRNRVAAQLSTLLARNTQTARAGCPWQTDRAALRSRDNKARWSTPRADKLRRNSRTSGQTAAGSWLSGGAVDVGSGLTVTIAISSGVA